MLNKVEKNKKHETFNKKAKMLNIGLDEQINMLNSMYADKGIRFKKDNENKVFVEICKSIDVLELPEFDYYSECYPVKNKLLDDSYFINISKHAKDFDGNHYSLFSSRLLTLKLPKSIKEVDFKRLRLPGVSSLWIWDTTDIKNMDELRSQSLKMIVIRSTTGGKSKIFKF